MASARLVAAMIGRVGQVGMTLPAGVQAQDGAGPLPPARGRGRRLASELALALASILLLLGVGEAALRLSGWGPRYEKTRVRLTTGRDLTVRANTLVLDCYPSDPRHYFDINLRDPAVRARYAAQGVSRLEELGDEFPHAVEFRYNGAGFRDGEFRLRSPGVRRVVVLGDSFTEGQGVKEADTYVRRLEGLLNAAEPGQWQVLNYGYRAQDFPALYATFEQALRLEPDLVIFGMVLNDADRDPVFDRQWPRLNDWIMLRRPSLAMPWWRLRVEAYVRDRIESWRIARDTTAWYRQLYGPANAGGWARTRQYLRLMNRAQRERGKALLVALWPLMVGLEGPYPFEAEHAKIGAACQQRQIPFRDLLPVLRGRRSIDLWAHPADMHPNDLAQRLVAEDLAAWVLRSVPVATGSRPPGETIELERQPPHSGSPVHRGP
jgi:lysophospholipase L1-like esterase